jgi:hypothetical protein
MSSTIHVGDGIQALAAGLGDGEHAGEGVARLSEHAGDGLHPFPGAGKTARQPVARALRIHRQLAQLVARHIDAADHLLAVELQPDGQRESVGHTIMIPCCEPSSFPP